MNINPTLSGEENLLRLILQNNPQAPTIGLAEVEFGQPSLDEGEVGMNTSVVLTMKPNASLRGEQTFRYSRLMVGGATTSPIFEAQYTPTVSFADLLELISQELGIRADQISFGSLPDSQAKPVVWNHTTKQAIWDEQAYSFPIDIYRIFGDSIVFEVVAVDVSLLYTGNADIDVYSSATLDQLIPEAFDGFNAELADLDRFVDTVLDGFDEFTYDLDLLIKTKLDGFDPAPDTRVDLNAVTKLVFSGVNRKSVVPLQELVTGVLPGWKMYEASLEDLIPDVLNGFDKVNISLSTIISTVFTGFTREDGDLNIVIPSVLKGFDYTSGALSDNVSTVLGGFTGIITDINDLIFNDNLGGFYWTERELSSVGKIVLDGFDPVPEWRIPLNGVTHLVFDAVTKKTALTSGDVVSGVVSGFVNQDA